jgi:hypothetical protein
MSLDTIRIGVMYPNYIKRYHCNLTTFDVPKYCNVAYLIQYFRIYRKMGMSHAHGLELIISRLSDSTLNSIECEVYKNVFTPNTPNLPVIDSCIVNACDDKVILTNDLKDRILNKGLCLSDCNIINGSILCFIIVPLNLKQSHEPLEDTRGG